MHSGELAGQDYSPTMGRGRQLLEDYSMKRGVVYGGIIVAAMLAFELFNYSTTDFALTNLLGDLRFLGIRWAMILAIAFCGMDFAGIARLFTPERGRAERGERVEVWYLLAAWFLAATMNAILTWWGVSLALLEHANLGNEILSRGVLLSVVPVFVAIMVWLIRILLIGMMSMAGERLFSRVEDAVRTSDERELLIEPALERVYEPRPIPAPAHLPTAAWRGSANSAANNGGHQRSPLPSQSRPARVIGTPDDEPVGRRPATVAERHGYGRPAQPNRPAAPPPPSQMSARPAPKPPTSAPPPRPVIARVPEMRLPDTRPLGGGLNGNGNGNGQTRGNGYGNGNGNGQSNGGNSHASSPNPSRSFDPDLDDYPLEPPAGQSAGPA